MGTKEVYLLSANRYRELSTLCICFLLLLVPLSVDAQQIFGAITGTVKDSTGSVVPNATITIRNVGTNIRSTIQSTGGGTYTVPNLQVGSYEVTFTANGFQKETHSNIQVEGDRTTTVDGTLRVGQQSTTVEVTGTPLMDQTDTTNGYVVDQLTIQNTPLGTGSFTQLAILAPGVHADFLSGAGSNAGLGNQGIFANGQRESSNEFRLNGIDTNNLFNGQSTSSVGENRFVLNTGESFGAGGETQTSTSIYAAIGQALPTPAPEAVQEISVNTSMFSADQGNYSGAHISVITKSGTNDMHGGIYERFQNSDMNAAPFFYNASPAIIDKVPFLNRNMFGATLGGPIKKNKLFYFVAYQGVRIADAQDATKTVYVPLGLNSSNRNAAGLAALAGISPSQVSPQAVALFGATLKNGQYLIPNAQITSYSQAKALGYDAVVQGPNAQATVDQGNANVDYVFSERDRLSVKYYIQNDPTVDPFGYGGDSLGFGQTLSAGSQVGSIDNTTILSPNLTWTQRSGFTRMRAYANTGQNYTASQFGINLFGAAKGSFPFIEIADVDPQLGQTFEFGTPVSFGNEGMFQNQWEQASSIDWVKGKHTITIGAQWDHTQLNIINADDNDSQLDYTSLTNFLEGNVRTGANSYEFSGSSNRYYRDDTVGAFINDQYKVRSNLTVTLGLRWDYDGPFSEKNGNLTAFNGNLYQYNAGTDTIVNDGLEIASNNKTLGTAGVGDTLLKQRQWGFAPRIGIAYSPTPKLTIRTGAGIYYDRGEYFTELSPSAGGGYSGPFGVTLEPPFVSHVTAVKGATTAYPFGTAGPAAPPSTPATVLASLPDLAKTIDGSAPFSFGGYDINNKLPYSENWTFDIQFQPSNSWLFTIGYVGTHSLHQTLPIPYNQPSIATPQSPVYNQIYSYGFNENALEPVETYDGGNVDARVPYLGYSPNAMLYKAEGIAWYNAMTVSLKHRFSHGLEFTASYTWSHSLDEQSGLGLFYTGNNPLAPATGYATSDFDRPQVFLVNYTYEIPKATNNKLLGAFINGWQLGGQTVAESGEPYSIYDYSGSVGSLYYSSNDYITNPIIGLPAGVSASQAELQGTTGVNPGKPVLNVNDFAPVFLAPGQDGVPPCDSKGVCDNYESVFGSAGRNQFRGPFGVRFDMTIGKDFRLSERFRLRFNVDAFNIFNHPNFDAPNNDVAFFPSYEPPPTYPPSGSLGIIQHTIGSPRFLQLDLHLNF
ncbi:MAG: carboxypeptidase regulatory-like domain-containing protein [Bryobacteraceae bacterium]